MGLGKKVASFDWERGLNSAPRDGQKIPCDVIGWSVRFLVKCTCSFKRSLN